MHGINDSGRNRRYLLTSACTPCASANASPRPEPPQPGVLSGLPILPRLRGQGRRARLLMEPDAALGHSNWQRCCDYQQPAVHGPGRVLHRPGRLPFVNHAVGLSLRGDALPALAKFPADEAEGSTS
jgi:hypothetical protein